MRIYLDQIGCRLNYSEMETLAQRLQAVGHQTVQQAEQAQKAKPTMGTFIGNLALVQPAITAFFEGVLVMDEDAAVRENRLALLQGVAGLAKGMADLAQLEGF